MVMEPLYTTVTLLVATLSISRNSGLVLTASITAAMASASVSGGGRRAWRDDGDDIHSRQVVRQRERTFIYIIVYISNYLSVALVVGPWYTKLLLSLL